MKGREMQGNQDFQQEVVTEIQETFDEMTFMDSIVSKQEMWLNAQCVTFNDERIKKLSALAQKIVDVIGLEEIEEAERIASQLADEYIEE